MKEPLTEEHIQALRSALQGHPLEAIITLALVTGMRRNELLHLTWQDVDMEKRELRVLNSKTKRDRRTIPLSEEVTNILQQHRLRQEGQRAEVGLSWHDQNLVFPNHTGGLLISSQLEQDLHDFLVQAKLPAIRVHDFRETRWLNERHSRLSED